MSKLIYPKVVPESNDVQSTSKKESLKTRLLRPFYVWRGKRRFIKQQLAQAKKLKDDIKTFRNLKRIIIWLDEVGLKTTIQKRIFWGDLIYYYKIAPEVHNAIVGVFKEEGYYDDKKADVEKILTEVTKFASWIGQKALPNRKLRKNIKAKFVKQKQTRTEIAAKMIEQLQNQYFQTKKLIDTVKNMGKEKEPPIKPAKRKVETVNATHAEKVLEGKK